MRGFLSILVGLMMIATLGVLLAGAFTMARAEGDPRRSNMLMRWRVILQFGAIVLFIIFMSLLRG
jgi:hypothetical protein